MRAFACAAALVLAASGATLAQDDQPAYPPTVVDLAPGYEFADGANPDILGIHLGSTSEEVEAALKAAYPDAGEVRHEDQVFSLKDNKGHEVSFSYRTSSRIDASSDKGSSSIAVYYTTAISGARVAQINRQDQYDAEPDTAPLLESLKAKYGEPSRDNEFLGYDGRELEWEWIDGKLVKDGSTDYDASNCRGISIYYTYDANRTDQRQGCTAWLAVKVHYGQTKDTVSRLSVEFIGARRDWDNYTATDRWLLDQMDAMQRADGGPATPAF